MLIYMHWKLCRLQCCNFICVGAGQAVIIISLFLCKNNQRGRKKMKPGGVLSSFMITTQHKKPAGYIYLKCLKQGKPVHRQGHGQWCEECNWKATGAETAGKFLLVCEHQNRFKVLNWPPNYSNPNRRHELVNQVWSTEATLFKLPGLKPFAANVESIDYQLWSWLGERGGWTTKTGCRSTINLIHTNSKRRK